jgi:hypothetical protein
MNDLYAPRDCSDVFGRMSQEIVLKGYRSACNEKRSDQECGLFQFALLILD